MSTKTWSSPSLQFARDAAGDNVAAGRLGELVLPEPMKRSPCLFLSKKRNRPRRGRTGDEEGAVFGLVAPEACRVDWIKSVLAAARPRERRP